MWLHNFPSAKGTVLLHGIEVPAKEVAPDNALDFPYLEVDGKVFKTVEEALDYGVFPLHGMTYPSPYGMIHLTPAGKKVTFSIQNREPLTKALLLATTKHKVLPKEIRHLIPALRTLLNKLHGLSVPKKYDIDLNHCPEEVRPHIQKALRIFDICATVYRKKLDTLVKVTDLVPLHDFRNCLNTLCAVHGVSNLEVVWGRGWAKQYPVHTLICKSSFYPEGMDTDDIHSVYFTMDCRTYEGYTKMRIYGAK